MLNNDLDKTCFFLQMKTTEKYINVLLIFTKIQANYSCSCVKSIRLSFLLCMWCLKFFLRQLRMEQRVWSWTLNSVQMVSPFSCTMTQLKGQLMELGDCRTWLLRKSGSWIQLQSTGYGKWTALKLDLQQWKNNSWWTKLLIWSITDEYFLKFKT